MDMFTFWVSSRRNNNSEVKENAHVHADKPMTTQLLDIKHIDYISVMMNQSAESNSESQLFDRAQYWLSLVRKFTQNTS